MIRLPTLSLLLLGLLYGLCTTLAVESDAPFIYYFSPEDHAIIVERADGADRHTIGQNVIGSDEYASHTSWSPSGEWVAWVTSDYQTDMDTNLSRKPLWLAHSDGTHLTMLWDNMGVGNWSLAWSSLNDWLLIAFKDGAFGDSSDILTFMIIDIESGQSESHNIPNPLGLANPRWTPDGKYVTYNDYGDTNGMNVITPFENRVLRFARHTEIYALEWLPDGRLLFIPSENGDVYRIADLATGSVVDIPRLEGDTDFVWNTIGTDALIFVEVEEGSLPDTTPHDLWWFDIETLALTKIADNVLSPHNVIANRHGSILGNTAWLPDGKSAIYGDYDGTLYHVYFDPFAIESFELPGNPIDNQIIPPALGIEWSQHDDFGLLMWSGYVWRFDLEDFTLSPEPVFRRWNFRLSPDGRYVAFIGSCADPFVVGKCIMDLETKTTIDIPPINHDPSQILWTRGFISWHPSQNYVRFVELISEEDTLRYVPSFSYADGTFYREPTAVWLPTNVQID